MKKLSLLLFLLTLLVVNIPVSAQLTGTKSIPGDYATIEAAITDLNLQGVGSGGVTFNVAAGHTESITTTLIITATGNSTNPIIFQKSGSGANPLITRTDAGIISTSAIGADGDAIIRLNGTDYITFNGIDLAATAQGIEYGYYTYKPSGTDGCQFVTISNCVITMTKGTSGYVIGINISNGPTSSSSATGVTVTASSGINSNITITGNTITNVHAGVYIRGSSATGFYDSDITVGQSGAGNTITNFGGGSATTTYGVYFIYVNNPTVAYNTITSATHGATLYGIFYSTVIGNVIGSNNNFNLANNSASSATQYIYNSNTVTSEDFSNNTFAAGTLSSTGTVYLIYASNSTPIVNVSGNQTAVTITRTGASGSFYCYYNLGSPSSGTETLSNNNFSNISVTGTSSLYGIYSNTATGQNRVSYNNTISNWTGGTGSCYALYHLSTTSNTIYNNSIHDITTGGTFYGLYFSGTNPTVYGNNIYNITTNGTTLYGIYDAGTGTTNCYKNQVYNLTANNAAATLYGFYITTGTSNYVYNNFVSDLKTPILNSTTLTGMYVSGGTFIGLYYNTIYLNATSSGANFGSNGIYASTTPTVELRNNVVVNTSTPAGTGYTVAYRRSTTTLTTYAATSNNNDFYAGTPSASNLIFYDGTNSDQTLADYKIRVSPRDANSVTENPPFVNVTTTPYDLHINTSIATQVESGGAPISSPIAINVDFDGDTRNASTPDIGADEFSGTPADFTSPNIIYTPLANTSSLSSRTIVATVTDPSGVPTSDPGMPRLYWKINFSGSYSAAAPTYLGSNQYQYSFGGGVATGDTVYYYFVARDQAGTPNIGSAPGGASGFTYDPPAASTPPPSPSSYRIVPSISGIVTVGSGGTYPSLTGAGGLFEAINSNVVNGNIIANVISDLTEDGTNALNQWIEEPDGSNFTVTIQPSAASERLISGDVATGMIRLNGADRVTFDGRFSGSGSYLRFRNTNTSDPTFKFLSGASNNTIRNCIIEGVATSTLDGVIYFGGTANNNNKILSCDIRDRSDAAGKPATGIYFSSTSDSGNTIMSCNIFNFNQYSVYISAATNTTIDSCNTFMTTASTSSTVYNIYIVNAVGTKILKNKIYDINGSSSATIKGIYFSGSSSRPVDVRIENNSISLSPITTGSVDGIDYFGYASNSAFIYYNSIYIGGTATAGNSYGIRYRDDVNAYVQYNNVVFNARTGGTGKHYAMYFDILQPYVTLNMDYNDYFANGTNGYLGYWGTDISDLTTWKTTSAKDTNSISTDPLYNSTSNLQPLVGSPVIGVGLPIAGISTDILNNPRSGSNPSMGAYEIAGDFAGPAISYTLLSNTSSLANRTLTPVTISDVSGVNGTSGTAPRIYYKKKSDANVFGANNSSFSGWKWTESTGSSPFTFTIDYSIIFGGSISVGDTVQYFVVAQDLASTPNVGANPSTGFSATSVSSISSAPTTPNFYKIVGAPLSGTYTVGISAFNKATGKNLVPIKHTRVIKKNISPYAIDSNIDPFIPSDSKDEDLTEIINTKINSKSNEPMIVDQLQEYYVFYDGQNEYKGDLVAPSLVEGIEAAYATLTAAINDINERGVAGPVTFSLIDTLYPSETYPLDLSNIVGTSATNTVTFKPATGVNARIPGSVIQTTATFRFGGAQYVIIDGSNTIGGSTKNLTIDEPAAGTLPTIHFYSDAKYNTIKNTVIRGQNSSSGSGVILFGNGTNGSKFNTIENCTIKDYPSSPRPLVGVYWVSTLTNDSNSVKNCDIYDWTTYGIYLLGNPTTGTLLESNRIYQTSPSPSVTSVYGIRVDYGKNTLISKNNIYDISSTSNPCTIYGIQYWGSTSAMNVDIINNFISINASSTEDSATIYGLDLFAYSANSVNAFHNSIFIGGSNVTSGSSYAIAKRSGFVNYNTSNNIAINSRSNSTGLGKHYATYFSSTSVTGTFTMNYNNYYVSGTGGVLGYWTTDKATLSDWKTASGKDANSVSVAVTFAGPTDLHLSGSSIQDPYLAGTPIPGITTDIDGQTRSASFPYKGADESTAFNIYNLNLTALIEAMYDGSSMVPDTVVVELRNTSSPYSLVDQAAVVLNTSGNGTASYIFAANAVNYYIAIKHRNALQTWSATGQAFSGGTLNYNFTTSASQAYGSNQVLVGTKYCLYSGDVSDGVTAGLQDGFIDIFDDFEVYNDSYSANYRLLTDLNLDGFVDIFDDLYVYNNSYNGVTASYPGFPRPGFLKKDSNKIKINNQVE